LVAASSARSAAFFAASGSFIAGEMQRSRMSWFTSWTTSSTWPRAVEALRRGPRAQCTPLMVLGTKCTERHLGESFCRPWEGMANWLYQPWRYIHGAASESDNGSSACARGRPDLGGRQRVARVQPAAGQLRAVGRDRARLRERLAVDLQERDLQPWAAEPCRRRLVRLAWRTSDGVY
jgi:hypothetical protein